MKNIYKKLLFLILSVIGLTGLFQNVEAYRYGRRFGGYRGSRYSPRYYSYNYGYGRPYYRSYWSGRPGFGLGFWF